MLWRCFAVGAIVLAACGGKTDTGVSHNNGGTGSLNLSVKADVDAVFSSTGSPTDLIVKIQDGAGNKVTGATVTVSNLTWGSVTLTETTPGASGDYRKTQPSFPSGDFGLSVSCNPCNVPAISTTATITGNIQGVVLGGPGPHTINYPRAGVAGSGTHSGARWSTTPGPAALPRHSTSQIAPPLAPRNRDLPTTGRNNNASPTQTPH